MASAATYTPIQTQTVSGSTTNTIIFSSIPQTYTDLVLIASTLSTVASYSHIQVGNGSVDTGSNYSATILYGNGSTAGSIRRTNQPNFDVIYSTGDSATATAIVHFMNYSNSTTYKTMLARGNYTSSDVEVDVNTWRSTSPINIITLTQGSGYLIAGSTFTLYGILAA